MARLLLIIALLSGMTVVQAQAQAQVPAQVLLYGDDNYPPVIYQQGSETHGVLADLLRFVARDIRLPITLELYPWKRAYSLAAQGKAGIIGVSWNEERAQQFDYSDPIYRDDINVVVMKGREFAFARPQDLAGKRVGGQIGASYGNEADLALARADVVLERDTDQRARLRKLRAGRIDCALIGNGAEGFRQLISSDPELQARADDFVVLPVPLARDTLFLAFAKSQRMQPFLAQFNASLKNWQKQRPRGS